EPGRRGAGRLLGRELSGKAVRRRETADPRDGAGSRAFEPGSPPCIGASRSVAMSRRNRSVWRQVVHRRGYLTSSPSRSPGGGTGFRRVRPEGACTIRIESPVARQGEG